MLSCAPKPASPGRNQNGTVKNPKIGGETLEAPAMASVTTAPIPQNSKTRFVIDIDIFLRLYRYAALPTPALRCS
jgi:hypothetical protein